MEKYSLVCVGGGPAGISLAVECIEMGLPREEILILEKGEAPIKAIRQFYPEKKMTLANYKNLPTETHGHLEAFPDLTKQETLVYFDELIHRYKLQYRLNAEVSKIELDSEGLLRILVNQETVCAQNVGIGIGILGRPNKPKYKLPLKLRKKLLFDLTSEPVSSGKILIVGGGDTSSEYAQILCDEDCDVTLSCRSEKITRMMESNLSAVEALVEKEKLKLYMSCEIERIDEEEGEIKVIFKDREPEVFDRVIFAIGGTTPVNFLKSIGIEFNEDGWPKFSEYGETNIPGVFLVGDLVAGRTGGSIITAYNASFRAAQRILNRLKSGG